MREEQTSDLDPSAFDFLSDVLLLRTSGEREDELATRSSSCPRDHRRRASRTPRFYAYARFIALNELAATRSSSHHGRRVPSSAAETAKAWPPPCSGDLDARHQARADVRARLALLSEIPEEWAAPAERWSKLCERHWSGATPDRKVEYLLYQTLVGAWPIATERVSLMPRRRVVR